MLETIIAFDLVHFVAVAVGIFLIVYFLWEAFETVVLPRTVTHGWRFMRSFTRLLWRGIWQPIGQRFEDFRQADVFLGIFGPISLIVLLQVWVVALVSGYSLILWGLRTPIHGAPHPTFGNYLYLSGVTFFTLGYGDLTPTSGLGRFFGVFEAGMGYGFLALIIAYAPVLYAAFSRRESSVTLLDARAGSPPSALELFRRHAANDALPDLDVLLKSMEHWIADLLESSLSYPVISFYRSQHDDQSWMSALIVIMDVCAMILTGVDGVPTWQAQLTFAMGRHALVDLALIYNTPPAERYLSRLTPPDMERIVRILAQNDIPFHDADTAPFQLAELRRSYEPYAISLARLMSFALPPFVPTSDAADDWQRSAWERAEHF